MQIESDVSQTFFNGSKVVGTSAVKLGNGTVKRGIQLLADTNNSALIYVGRSDVTPGTASETDGFPLQPGKGLFVPVEKLELIYLLSTEAAQKVWYFAV